MSNQRFNIDPLYGILPPCPAKQLPSSFAPLSETVNDLPHLARSGAELLRKEILKIPLLPIDKLSGSELRLALLYYHMLQSAYIHAGEGNSVIPKNIAVPSFLLTQKLTCDAFQKPPILGYGSYVLDNRKLVDEAGGFSLGNLEPLATFTGTDSEKAFIIAHLLIEKDAAPGIQATLALPDAIKSERKIGLFDPLHAIESSISRMQGWFPFLLKHVAPILYQENIRPWLMSFTEIIYDGVDPYEGKPQNFRGASGMQTPTIPAFSAALGIQYTNRAIVESFSDTKKYLYPNHQRFLRFLEDGPNLREYVKRNPLLKRPYNDCIETLVKFRVAHAHFIAPYIAPKGEDPRGTGGTPVPWWLEAVIEETRAHLL